MDIPGSRLKRSHSEVDDCDECLPISKRINRLHIEAQRKSQGEEHHVPALQVNGNAAVVSPQPSTSWQSASAQSPAGFDVGHGFSPPYFAADVRTPSSTCSSCGVLPQGIQCSHMSLTLQDAQQTLHQHSPANIPAQQYTSGVPIISGFPQDSAGSSVTQQQFQQFVSQGPCSPFGSSVDSVYDPELNESENPYYFHINEVLFNAHYQRMQRSSTLSPDAGS